MYPWDGPSRDLFWCTDDAVRCGTRQVPGAGPGDGTGTKAHHTPHTLPVLTRSCLIKRKTFNYFNKDLFFDLTLINFGLKEENNIQNFFVFIQVGAGPAPAKKYRLSNTDLTPLEDSVYKSLQTTYP